MAPEYTTTVPQEVCILRHEIVDTKIEAVEKRMDGVEGIIAEVRDLQIKILYAIIGLFGASILTLIGVLAGRAIDFRMFFP
jgi:hypothetical protein